MAQGPPYGPREGLRALSQAGAPQNLLPVLDTLLWFHLHNATWLDHPQEIRWLTCLFSQPAPFVPLIFPPVAQTALAHGVFLSVFAADYTDGHLLLLQVSFRHIRKVVKETGRPGPEI